MNNKRKKKEILKKKLKNKIKCRFHFQMRKTYRQLPLPGPNLLIHA
jgi:hypothetical protein